MTSVALALRGIAYIFHHTNEATASASGVASAQVASAEELEEIPASVMAQCRIIYTVCTQGFDVAGCKDGLQTLIRYYESLPSMDDTQLLYKRIMFDEGCHYHTPKCTASYGSYVGAGYEGNQPGTVADPVEICRRDVPVCTGVVAGASGLTTKGNCQKAIPGFLSWPTGETATCKNTLGWTNGFVNCNMQTSDTGLCADGGWTCSGYIRMTFCTNGNPVVWGPTDPATSGLAMNYPENNCCACGGSAQKVTAPHPVW